MTPVFDKSFRAQNNRDLKLRKERELYRTEKDGARVKSVSARYPAYAGTALEAKHGGKKNAKIDRFNREKGRQSDGDAESGKQNNP